MSWGWWDECGWSVGCKWWGSVVGGRGKCERDGNVVLCGCMVGSVIGCGLAEV